MSNAHDAFFTTEDEGLAKPAEIAKEHCEEYRNVVAQHDARRKK